MAFQIIRNDITKVKADAIVNTANPHVTVGSGVDNAIYEAAGRTELIAAREKLGELPEGTVGVTPAFKLDARYIIHVSGPRWKGGNSGEASVLRQCYDRSLEEAEKLGCTSVAFPFLATGAYGFPKEEALDIAISAFSHFLLKHDMDILLVMFDKESFHLSGKLFDDLREYVDENYVSETLQEETRGRERERYEHSSYMPDACGSPFRTADYDEDLATPDADYDEDLATPDADYDEDLAASDDENFDDDFAISDDANVAAPINFSVSHAMACPKQVSEYLAPSLPSSINSIATEESTSFDEYLQQLINRKGYKNSEVYKRANLTKQYFSKLMKGQINPTKEKLLSISIALKLNLDETRDMLMMAGYALSPCSKVDLVVKYFISNKNYDMFDVEIALSDLGLPTLASY